MAHTLRYLPHKRLRVRYLTITPTLTVPRAVSLGMHPHELAMVLQLGLNWIATNRQWRCILLRRGMKCLRDTDKIHVPDCAARGSKKMVVAALALSLRRAAWITPRVRDTLGVKATLLIILHCYVKRICATRLRFEQRSQRSRLERRQRPFPSTIK